GKVESVNGKTGEVILSASDVGAVPVSRTINDKPLSSNISLTKSDIGLGNVDNVKQVPTTRTINGKALTSNITIDVSDIPGLVSSRLALGQNALAQRNYAVAIGRDASADGDNSISIGRYATTWHYSVAIGRGAVADG